MKKEDLFLLVSKNANYIDVSVIELVYYALIRTLGQELRSRKQADLPEWGTFYLHRHSPRMSLNVNSGSFSPLEAKTTVKFTPHYKLKQHFYEVGA